MARRRKKSGLRDQLREMIDSDGRSRYELCRLAEMDQAAMSRFMAGKAEITLRTAERLMVILNLELVRKD